MTLSLLIANGASWAMQVLLMAGATGLALALLRVADPKVRLRSWHAAIGLSLLLPLVGRWEAPAAPLPGAPSVAAAGATIPWQVWIASVVLVGISARFVWLCVGVGKLRGLYRRSTSWRPAWFERLSQTVGATASIGVSRDIRSAVTFGLRRPSILVPHRLVAAPESHQRAVVAHELRHVARRDWLWVLGEEAVRTVFWWHPAIWLALDEARLAREELVDREAIALTDSRSSYLEALVAAAEPHGAVVGGFVPHFYRRRQLEIQDSTVAQGERHVPEANARVRRRDCSCLAGDGMGCRVRVSSRCGRGRAGRRHTGSRPASAPAASTTGATSANKG